MMRHSVTKSETNTWHAVLQETRFAVYWIALSDPTVLPRGLEGSSFIDPVLLQEET